MLAGSDLLHLCKVNCFRALIGRNSIHQKINVSEFVSLHMTADLQNCWLDGSRLYRPVPRHKDSLFLDLAEPSLNQPPTGS